MAKIYVGNLPYTVNDDSLSDLFKDYGTVVSSKCITDRVTGQSKGFGFVELSNEDEANAAIEAMNRAEVGGRTIKVSIAYDKPQGNGGGYRERNNNYQDRY